MKTIKRYIVNEEIKSFYRGKIGTLLDANYRDSLLRFEDGTENWFSNSLITEYIPDTSGWAVGEFCLVKLDGVEVTGRVILVAKTYLKIRITEGRNKDRDVVRQPIDISRNCVKEVTQYRLSFKHGQPGFVSGGNQYFDTEDQAFEYLERNAVKNNITDITLTKVITRTEIPRPVTLKVSFSY